MKTSKYQKVKIEKENTELKKRANALYKQGLTLRMVGKLIGRSHEWVRKQVGTESG